jgi:hypothetical protein
VQQRDQNGHRNTHRVGPEITDSTPAATALLSTHQTRREARRLWRRKLSYSARSIAAPYAGSERVMQAGSGRSSSRSPTSRVSCDEARRQSDNPIPWPPGTRAIPPRSHVPSRAKARRLVHSRSFTEAAGLPPIPISQFANLVWPAPARGQPQLEDGQWKLHSQAGRF